MTKNSISTRSESMSKKQNNPKDPRRRAAEMMERAKTIVIPSPEFKALDCSRPEFRHLRDQGKEFVTLNTRRAA
jgi:hypothetical protein